MSGSKASNAGYSRGSADTARYAEVSAPRLMPRAFAITYDSPRWSYGELLKVFSRGNDPPSVNSRRTTMWKRPARRSLRRSHAAEVAGSISSFNQPASRSQLPRGGSKTLFPVGLPPRAL